MPTFFPLYSLKGVSISLILFIILFIIFKGKTNNVGSLKYGRAIVFMLPFILMVVSLFYSSDFIFVELKFNL